MGNRKIHTLLCNFCNFHHSCTVVQFSGISRRSIQECLNEDPNHFRANPAFLNKEAPKPVTASAPMERLQADLVNLASISVCMEGTTYKYVLVVIDVFSRFLWLRALPEKTAGNVARELDHLSLQFGQPRILQTDNGSEFLGAVKTICSKRGITKITSRPSHPQSQGKVMYI